VKYNHLLSAFQGVDLVWILNLCSLPYNGKAADLAGRADSELNIPTIFNHHDLPWEHGFDYNVPIDTKRPWHTVTTSKFLLESIR
jgi:hypothetical protein